MGRDFGFDGGFGHHTDELLGDLAIFEKEHRGDGADAVIGGDGVVVVDVDLGDLNLAGHLGGEFFEDGRDGFEGAAPGCPEIDEQWRGGGGDGGFEIIGGEIGDFVGHVDEGCGLKEGLGGGERKRGNQRGVDLWRISASS